MAIASAVQRGPIVYVYDAQGMQIAVIDGGNGKDDGLKGYTGSTVTVRRGYLLYTYDERGFQLSVTQAR